MIKMNNIIISFQEAMKSLRTEIKKDTFQEMTPEQKKRSDKRFAKREAAEKFTFDTDVNASEWLAEKNIENAKNNLPSSMR